MSFETVRELADTRPVQAMIGLVGVMALTAEFGVAAQWQDRPPAAIQEAPHEYGSLKIGGLQAIRDQRFELIHLIERQEKIDAMRASVTPNIDGVILVKHNGDVTAANDELVTRHLPPMTPVQATQITTQMHYRFTAAQKQTVSAQNVTWETLTPETQLRPVIHPEMVVRALTTELQPSQEQRIRRSIVELAESYLGVAEIGQTNSGPIVDLFTGKHPEYWCADFVSYIYNAAGVPFNGGSTYGRPDWQLSRTLSKPSDKIMAMQGWFRDYGTVFTAAERLPEPGDVVLKKRPGGGHAMIVEQTLPNGKLILISPNTGDAVRRIVMSATDRTIVGFGSVFRK